MKTESEQKKEATKEKMSKFRIVYVRNKATKFAIEDEEKTFN